MVSMHTMKACRASGNKAPFILNFGTRLRWLGKLATRSLHPRGRKPQRPLIGGWLAARAGLDAFKRRKIFSSGGIRTPDRLSRRLDTLPMRSRVYVVKCTNSVILASRMLHPVAYYCVASAPHSYDRGSICFHPFALCETPSASSSYPLATWHFDRPVQRSTAKNIHGEAGARACDRHGVRSPSVRGGGVWPVSCGQLMNKENHTRLRIQWKAAVHFAVQLLNGLKGRTFTFERCNASSVFNVCVSTRRELREVFCR
jgi:hypothetical protein